MTFLENSLHVWSSHSRPKIPDITKVQRRKRRRQKTRENLCVLIIMKVIISETGKHANNHKIRSVFPPQRQTSFVLRFAMIPCPLLSPVHHLDYAHIFTHTAAFLFIYIHSHSCIHIQWKKVEIFFHFSPFFLFLFRQNNGATENVRVPVKCMLREQKQKTQLRK